eukprot:Awhi_evm1s8123
MVSPVPYRPFSLIVNESSDNIFLKMLAHDKTRDLFRKKLIQEASVENLLFWETVQEYQETANKIYSHILYHDSHYDKFKDSKLKGVRDKKKLTPVSAKNILHRQAKRIFDAHMAPGSTYEINLNQVIIKKAFKCIERQCITETELAVPRNDDEDTTANISNDGLTSSTSIYSMASISSLTSFDSLMDIVDDPIHSASLEDLLATVPFALDAQQKFPNPESSEDNVVLSLAPKSRKEIPKYDLSKNDKKKSIAKTRKSSLKPSENAKFKTPSVIANARSRCMSMAISRPRDRPTSVVPPKRLSVGRITEDDYKLASATASTTYIQQKQWNDLLEMVEVFDSAQHHITELMERDTFSRFRFSPEYQQVEMILERENETKRQSIPKKLKKSESISSLK